MASNNIMNIPSTTTNVNQCNEVCSFSFNYQTSYTCQVENKNGQYFNLTYNNSTNSVYFQNENYTVSNIQIYLPSRHYFNNTPLKGEIVIAHRSNTSKLLYICIPFDDQINASESPLLNNILSEIIDKQIIYDNQQHQLNLQQEYNLNSFVKYEPYYYYIGNKNNSEFFIVYQPSNGFRISTDLLNNVKKLLNSPYPPYPYIQDLYYNNNGPIASSGDDIYIDCQPVDEDGNLLIDKYDNINIIGIGGNNNVSYIILYSCVGGIILIILFYFIYKFNKTNNNMISSSLPIGNTSNSVNNPSSGSSNFSSSNPTALPSVLPLPTSFTIATRTLLKALGII
jgi:hypothetical protein